MSELERAHLSARLGKGDKEAQLLALYVTIVSRTERWQDFARSDRTTVTRRVSTGRSKPALAVGAERFFDDALGTVVFETRPDRSHVHAHVRTAPGP